MNIVRVQGLALLLGAICLPLSLLELGTDYSQYVASIGIVLIILGVPAINTRHTSGLTGLIGVALIILAAVIALGFRVGIAEGSGFEDVLIPISVMSALAGRIITGGLTIAKRVFSPWLGWGLIAVGVVNLAGSFDLGSVGNVISMTLVVLDAAVFAGFGIQIVFGTPHRVLPAATGDVEPHLR